MQLWIAFLLVSFGLGSRAATKDRSERLGITVIVCACVAGLFLFQRFA